MGLDKNMEDYRKLANRTECEYTFEVLQRNSDYIRLLHAVLGLTGELTEFRSAVEEQNQINILEELGDFYWYLAIIENILNIDFENDHDFQRTEGNPHELVNDLEYYICSMVDSLKRQIFYGAEGRDWVYMGYQTHLLLKTLCELFQTSESEVKAKNIAKLKARYGDKFSEDKAINRDLNKELGALNT